MKVGIVGNEAAKFTPSTELRAREIIRSLIQAGDTVVSGGCHLGGIDIWAEEEADRLGCEKLIFPPKQRSWEGGYKQRNIRIAEESDIVHCIVVKEYPPGYNGMRFPFCYHCSNKDYEAPVHVKSGGCWTVKYAKKLGKEGSIIVI